MREKRKHRKQSHEEETIKLPKLKKKKKKKKKQQQQQTNRLLGFYWTQSLYEIWIDNYKKAFMWAATILFQKRLEFLNIKVIK